MNVYFKCNSMQGLVDCQILTNKDGVTTNLNIRVPSPNCNNLLIMRDSPMRTGKNNVEQTFDMS